MAPSLSLLQRCLASLLVAQCSLGTNTHTQQPSVPRPTAATARAAWSRRRTAAAAFLAAPPARPGDSSGSSTGGSLEHLLRVLRLDDAIFALHQQPRQHPRRGEHVTAAVAAAAYNNIGRPPLTCWSKDQWTPRRDVSKWPSQRSHRQRTTRLTSWSKCQWSPTSYQPPVWRTRGSQRGGGGGGSATGARWQAGGGRARDWSKVQWTPLDDSSSSRAGATRLQGQGGFGGGAGAGSGVGAAGGGGGGAFNRVSIPPPPASSAAGAAGLGDRGGYQARGAASTVSRPAVAAAAVGSTGPKDLSGAPVEVIDSAERYFQVLKENAEEDKIVVIKIYAGFCRACKAFDRKFRLLSLDFQEQDANVKFFEMDWMKTRDLCKSLQKQVKKLPHLELYVGQRGRLESFVCGPSKSALLKDKLDKLVADPKDPSLGEAPIPDEDSLAEEAKEAKEPAASTSTSTSKSKSKSKSSQKEADL